MDRNIVILIVILFIAVWYAIHKFSNEEEMDKINKDEDDRQL